MDTPTPDNAARATPVAWLVTNGGRSCEPWLVYERSELDAHPADCIADPLYSASTVAALEAEVRELTADRDSWQEQASDRVADWDKERQRADAAERRVAELEALASTLHDATFFAQPFVEYAAVNAAKPELARECCRRINEAREAFTNTGARAK